MIKRNIYVMYAIALLQGMVFYAPIATLYRTAQGLSIFEITMIESISLVLCFLFEIPWGMIADRIGYKKTILLCNGLYWLSKIIFWQASDFGGFLAERILLAVVISGLSGVDVSILYMSCDKGNSQQVFGIYNALQTTGLLAASCVCSVYVGTQYQSAGFFTVISYGAAMILSFLLVERKRAEQTEKPNLFALLRSMKETVTSKKMMVFLLAVALFQQMHQTITVFLSQMQYEKLGASVSFMAVAYMIMTLVGLIGIFSARITECFGRRKVILICCAGAFIACLGLGQSNCMLFAAFFVFCLRAVFSIMEPLQTKLQNEQISSEYRATMLSIQTIVIDAAGAGMSLLLGAVAQHTLSGAFWMGAAFCIGAFGLFELWRYWSRA